MMIRGHGLSGSIISRNNLYSFFRINVWLMCLSSSCGTMVHTGVGHQGQGGWWGCCWLKKLIYWLCPWSKPKPEQPHLVSGIRGQYVTRRVRGCQVIKNGCMEDGVGDEGQWMKMKQTSYIWFGKKGCWNSSHWVWQILWFSLSIPFPYQIFLLCHTLLPTRDLNIHLGISSRSLT